MPRRIVLCSLFFFCFAGFLHAQGRALSNIRGQIAAPGLTILNSIEVLLEKAPNRLIARAFSDTTGAFEFQSLEAGRYEVIVRLAGYQESRQAVDIDGTIDFVNEPVDDQAPGPQISGPGGADRTVMIYAVLVKDVADGASDPNLVALRRKYPSKILQEYEKAREENQKGNPVRAAERLEALLKQAPDFYNAHNDLGIIYQRQQRYPDAERAFKAAHAINPESALQLVNLGTLYIQEADANQEKDPDRVGDILDAALDVLEEAVKLEPQAPTAHYLLGAAYYKSAFYTEAAENLKRALELDQAMHPARLMLINVYLRQEELEFALEELNAYIMENPNSANAAQIEEIRSRVIQNLGERR